MATIAPERSREQTGSGDTPRRSPMLILWLMSVVGLFVVAPVVVVLAHRVVRIALECQRYATDILEHGVGITSALDAVPALLDTRRAVSDVTSHATSYVSALRRVA
jgi:hypothetical protein